MDTNFLQKGQPCSKLKPSYVIFICLHDPFKKGEAVYRFEQIDSNLQLELNDEAYTMVLFHEIERQRRLNSKTDLVLLFPGFSRLGTSRTIILAIACPKGKIPKEMESFFTYVDSGEVSEKDDFVKRIHQKVEEANQNAEVTEIMTIEEELKVRWDWGYQEGEAIGLKKGRSEGAAQEKREIAKKFKLAGIPIDVIAENTGLTVEEVEKL